MCSFFKSSSKQDLVDLVEQQKARISVLESQVKQLQSAIQKDEGYMAALNKKCQNFERIVQQYQAESRSKLLSRSLIQPAV